MPAKPALYLIDGSSQMYRAYHAPVRTAEGGLLHNAKGQPTNAVYIFVTMDKDFFQLVRDGIRVFNPRDEGTWYDAPAVKEKFGVAPEQVVDVMALMGDTIDNIKGVPGIGDKGARELIATYGDLENLLA